MGAKLAGAVGALAPIDFLVSKSQIYCKFLTSRSRSLESLEKSSLHPHFLGPIGAHEYFILMRNR